MLVNCYILAKGPDSSAIIIDPGDDEFKIRKALARHNLSPGIIINTHGHFDHIGCDDKFGVAVFVHIEDEALLKDPELNLSTFLMTSFSVTSKIIAVKDKENIEFGQVQLEVIHMPGHTPGGIALLMKKPVGKILFTGDSLFHRGIGRTDFPGADGQVLIRAIKERLFVLDDNTVIYPGHGPASTIGEEKRKNPFFA